MKLCDKSWPSRTSPFVPILGVRRDISWTVVPRDLKVVYHAGLVGARPKGVQSLVCPFLSFNKCVGLKIWNPIHLPHLFTGLPTFGPKMGRSRAKMTQCVPCCGYCMLLSVIDRFLSLGLGPSRGKNNCLDYLGKAVSGTKITTSRPIDLWPIWSDSNPNHYLKTF